jgi:transposase
MRLIGMSQTNPTPVQPPVAAEHLPDDVATLKRMILELVVSLREQQRDNEALQQRLHRLLQRLYGPRGERFDPGQLLLFEEPAAGQDATASTTADEKKKPKRRCKPHGRRRLPQNLPHQPRHHELSEAERLCQGCGHLRVDIGADKSEQLDYRPASLFVIEHFVHKYVCPHCSKPAAARVGQEQPQRQEPTAMPQPEPSSAPPPLATTPAAGSLDTKAEQVGPSQPPRDQGPAPQPPTPACRPGEPGAVVIAASKPAMPIAKGLPGPGLLAHLIVSKYVDHLPLHRLERVYERQGLFLHRSTLCDWMAACAQVLRPLYERLVAIVLQSKALHTDDTPVKMQELVTHQLSTARLWTYLGDAAHPYNVFDFTLTRKRDGPQQFLASYQGYLHADAFSGYDGLYLPDPQTATARIIEVACTRRWPITDRSTSWNGMPKTSRMGNGCKCVRICRW